MTLILASTSAIRRHMLSASGVDFEPVAPGVDEAALKQAVRPASDIALVLAGAKALAVSAQRRDAWVIGSDSVVEVEGRQFDKPADRDEAAEHLRWFSGKSMHLTSAAALVRDGRVEWQHRGSAELHVRPLSEEFIEAYLAAEWPEVRYCVGVFRMEARGVQLFEQVEGDHFTILGMPLLPLLKALRERRLLPA